MSDENNIDNEPSLRNTSALLYKQYDAAFSFDTITNLEE